MRKFSHSTVLKVAEPICVSTPTSEVSKKPRKSGIYTRTGDGGTSALYTGERRGKDDAVFAALGTVDEFSSFIGSAREFLTASTQPPLVKICSFLDTIQQNLISVGAIVATPVSSKPEAAASLERFRPQDWTLATEALIDELDAALPRLTAFIHPGGGEAACRLHICRSVCRRAEREMVRARAEAPPGTYALQMDLALKYVNRLSDFFFVAARTATLKKDA